MYLYLYTYIHTHIHTHDIGLRPLQALHRLRRRAGRHQRLHPADLQGGGRADDHTTNNESNNNTTSTSTTTTTNHTVIPITILLMITDNSNHSNYNRLHPAGLQGNRHTIPRHQ